MTGIVKEQPLRKMTSAAYTVGRHSISDGFAVDCQVSAFFATTAQPRVLPDEESRTWHVPVRRFGRSHGSASALSNGNRTLSPVNLPASAKTSAPPRRRVPGAAFFIKQIPRYNRRYEEC